MKNLFLKLVVTVFFVSNVFANETQSDQVMVINNFKISNLEIIKNEKKSGLNYKFKRTDCATGGYSFFVPFYENNDLTNSKINSHSENGNIIFNVKNESFSSNFTISDLSVNEDNTMATFNVKKGNLIFPASIEGFNLTKEKLTEELSNFSDHPTLSEEDCPLCVIIVVVIISDSCEDARNACIGCTGDLVVGFCSCSCTQSQKKN